MKKLNKSRLFAVCVTAVFILNQAVFLFTPISTTQATTTGDISLDFFDFPLSPLSGTVTIKARVITTMTVDDVYLHWPGSGMGQARMTSAGNNEYSYNWDTTAFSNGAYQMEARAMYASMEYYSSDTVSVTVENESSNPPAVTPSVSANITVPYSGAILSGPTTVQAEVNSNVTLSDVKLHWPGSGMGYEVMNYQSGSLYSYSWDTPSWNNGSYEMYAAADYYHDGMLYTAESSSINVTVDNSTPDPPYANLTLTSPASNAILSGQVTVQVEVDTNIGDAVAELYWPGSSMGHQAMSYQSGNTYTYAWDTTILADGAYQMQAQVRAMYECISCGDSVNYYSDIISVTVKNNTGTTQELTAQITSPANDTKVAGIVNIQVQTSASDSSGNFNIYDKDGNIIKKDLPAVSSGNILSASWDTTAVVDGQYTIEIHGYIIGQDASGNETFIYAYDEIFVNVDNTTPPSDDTNYIMTMEFVFPPTTISNTATFSVQTSEEEVDVMFYIYKDGTLIKDFFSVYQGNKIYSLDWDTIPLSNGQYTLQAYAKKSGYIDLFKEITVTIKNDTTPPPTPDLYVDFIKVPQYIFGPTIISVQTNIEVDKVGFNITGPKNIDYTASYGGSNAYYFKWDITDWPDGLYYIKAIANKDTQSVTNDIKVNIQRDIPVEPWEMTFKEAYQPPLSGDKQVTVSLNKDVDKVDFSVEGAQSAKYAGVKMDSRHYYFIWATPKFLDDYYKVTASAFVGQEMVVSRTFSIQAQNTTEPIPPPPPPVEPLTITIVERLESPIAGDYHITAAVSQPVDKVEFRIEGPRSETFMGNKKDNYHYYFIWPTPKFPDGFYKIAIVARQGINEARKYENIEVRNGSMPIPDIIYEPSREIYEPPEEIDEWIMPECEKKGITSPEKCREYMHLPPECRDRGIMIWEECDKYLSVPPECRDKNLSQEECEKYMRMPWECRESGIFNDEECKKYMFQYTMPPECREAGAQTSEECSKTLFINSMPPECREAGIQTPEECNKIMDSMRFITYECKQAGIFNPEECNKYMMAYHMPPECKEAGITDPEECKKHIMLIHMPPECKEAGATTIEECDYVMREKYSDFDKMMEIRPEPVFELRYYKEEDRGMPPECREVGVITPEECERIMFAKHMPFECQEAGVKTKEECDKIMFLKHMPPECREANITDPEECKKHSMLLHMPPECQEAGVTNPEECEKIMFAKHAPPECIEARVTSPEECEKIMFIKYAPEDCRGAGIMTPEACKKYMFEKYGGPERIPVDKFPPECQKAGAKTPEECGKVMRKLYMPRECQEQGITDEHECDIYMQKKHMPPECREAGARTRQECDKIMFKKYAPSECRKAGVEDEQECEELMFNKYAPKVKCQGIDDWQCKSALKERHLGNIVAKQAQFTELRENVIQMVGEAVTVEDLEAMLELAKAIIPFKEKKIGLKIIAVREELILDEDENLIQTAPIALMIDSDQDGLSDDLEARLGTDPNNNDSDGDGYDDGTEVASNFNPMGEGDLEKPMAPVDQAIMANKTLGQPKVEGEVSENFVVQSIKNITDEQSGENKGYNLAGQAEAGLVVTVFIYSDLPLVATVQADEYGNWQYTLGKSLLEGEHEVYVALNDNTGKVVSKSNPLSFFIKEAKAVSVQDFVAVTAATSRIPTESESMLKYYIIIAGLVMVVGILLFIIFFVMQKRKQGLGT